MTLFPKSEHRILELIYERPGIRLNELMRDARVSAATAKRRLDQLLGSGIITEKRITGGRRTILRNLYPDLSSEEGKCVFSLLEAEKKHQFLRANKNLAGPFRQIVKNAEKSIKIILVFGSFATGSKTRDSDLDILFLVKNNVDKKRLKKEIERSFATFAQDISPRVDTLANFRRNIDKGMYLTIRKSHVIIKGSLDFIELIGRPE